jgi:DNA (cytosine-5)-methyltransferase 1
MKKFGGSGKMKQCCFDRKCPNGMVKDSAEDESSDTEMEVDVPVPESTKKDALKTPEKRTKRRHSSKISAKFMGEPSVEKNRRYYQECQIGENLFKIGDCVLVTNKDDDENVEAEPRIARIRALFAEDEDQCFHAEYFLRSDETILGCGTNPDKDGKDASEKNELFLCDDCDDHVLVDIIKKVKVNHKTPSENWYNEGGSAVVPTENDNEKWYEKWYDPEHVRFEDPPLVIRDTPGFCPSCDRNEVKQQNAKPVLGKPLINDDTKQTYKSLRFGGKDYQVGDSIYVLPSTYGFSVKAAPPPNPPGPKNTQDDLKTYPEAYRKSTYVKGSNESCPEPYRIARIMEISRKGGDSSWNKGKGIKIRVAKFYRPENTHRGIVASYEANLNMLYWSDEETVIDASEIVDKCFVKLVEHSDKFDCDEWFLNTADAFYFTTSYNTKTQELEPVSRSSLGETGKGGGKGGKGVKGKGKGKSEMLENGKVESDLLIQAKDPFCPKLERGPLKCLDIFAGCGGLSEGLHQAGIAESHWAIEKVESAAKAFKKNNPNCTVFDEDCNLLLKLVMDGETKYNGQKLPLKGQVELLCGGPPCQGFSGMNRFNHREYSAFKNSLVATYLSYCDYYRPKFFILENVRNFVSFKGGMVLKLALRCLVSMGYQCTFGVLQAGCYGVAQTRRRMILMAAAPGEILPMYPEPTHTFCPKALSLSVTIDQRRYESCISRMNSAPFRTTTVRDTMGDLPEIRNGAKKEVMEYGGEPMSHFQRLIRRGSEGRLHDHICKEMSSLVEARMRFIPLAPGSDWRDLPNIVYKLSDGTSSVVLRYTHKESKNGKGPGGALRGVCSCMEGPGKKCAPEFRQNNTLIPWCLPHTSNRHNQWAGLYGRVEWEGFFSTTITNPEPMGKQGRVLHPDQHRVVSARECARSQGFPDTYKFFGNVLDKHRQVGNAVPPPLARALGLEMKKSLLQKQERLRPEKTTLKTEQLSDSFKTEKEEGTETVLNEIGNIPIKA